MTTQFDSLSSVGRNYLNSQIFINNGELINIINNPSYITTYIIELMFNSSRYFPIYDNGSYQLNTISSTSNPNIIITAFSIFWLFTFLILFIFLIGSIIYNCYKDHRIKRQFRNGLIKVIRSKTKSKIVFIKKTWKKTLITLVTISVLLWIGFFILLCLEQAILSIKINSNNTNSTTSDKPYNSISNAASLSFNYINNLYNVITIDSIFFINNSVNAMNTLINNQIQFSIVKFANSILSSFYVSNIFIDATALLNGINLVINSMTYIYNNYKSLFNNISQISGQISVYQKNINQNLQTICPQLSSNTGLQTTCFNLLITNSQFKTTVDTSQINTDSSVIMLFILQQYSINITNITSSFVAVNSTFNSQLNSIFSSAVGTINVASYLSFILNLWNTTIIPLVTPIFNTISTNISNNTTTYISEGYMYENIIIILLIIIIFFMILLILISFYRETIANKYWNKYLILFLHLIIIFFSLISAIVAILLIISSNYLNTQVCQQFNTTNGIALSDQMINNYLASPWQNSIRVILNNPGSFPINLMQPTNILSGIITKCRNSSIGIFTALGMSNFVNITSIVQSSGLSNTLIQAQQNAYTAFINVNIKQVIPVQLNNFLAQTKQITTYFDAVDYTTSLAQLSIPLVGIVDYNSYFKQLTTFAQAAKNEIGSTNDVTSLNNQANGINNLNSSIYQIQNSMNIMKANYQVLQIYRNNTYLANLLTNDLNNASSILENTSYVDNTFNSTFNQIITIDMVNSIIQILNNNVTSITNQLVPCGNLSLTVEALTTTLCSSNNFKDSLASIGIFLIIVTVMCQIISILTIVSIILRLKFPKNVSKC